MLLLLTLEPPTQDCPGERKVAFRGCDLECQALWRELGSHMRLIFLFIWYLFTCIFSSETSDHEGAGKEGFL